MSCNEHVRHRKPHVYAGLEIPRLSTVDNFCWIPTLRVMRFMDAWTDVRLPPPCCSTMHKIVRCAARKRT